MFSKYYVLSLNSICCLPEGLSPQPSTVTGDPSSTPSVGEGLWEGRGRRWLELRSPQRNPVDVLTPTHTHTPPHRPLVRGNVPEASPSNLRHSPLRIRVASPGVASRPRLQASHSFFGPPRAPAPPPHTALPARRPESSPGAQVAGGAGRGRAHVSPTGP